MYTYLFIYFLFILLQRRNYDTRPLTAYWWKYFGSQKG